MRWHLHRYVLGANGVATYRSQVEKGDGIDSLISLLQEVIPLVHVANKDGIIERITIDVFDLTEELK